MKQELILFPLHSVLFPQAELTIRVFELRYRRMLDECGVGKPFGVVNIRYGKEVGEPAFPYDVGCAAYLVQQTALEDGSIIVRALGDKRFKILSIEIEHDGLARAQIEWLPDDSFVAIPDCFAEIVASFAECGATLHEAGSLAWRLAESLPLSLNEQQRLLEESDATKRLQLVKTWIKTHPFDL